MELRTERLVLRAPVIGDAAALFAVCSDPEVTRYLKFAPHAHVRETVDYLDRGDTLSRQSRGRLWIVTLGGEVIGTASVAVDESHAVTFGGFFARERWRNGYGLEAARAVVEYLTSNHTISRVAAQSDARNAAVAALLTKLGLHCEGRLAKAWPGFGEPPRDVFTWAWIRPEE